MFDWYWILAFAVPCYLLQALVHEASHAFFAVQHGLRVTSFKFWPHYVDHDNDPTTPRLFFWGRVTFVRTKEHIINAEERAMEAWAPFITGLPLWLICLGSEVVSSPSGLSWTFFYVFWGALTIDLTRGMLMPLWRKDKGDANQGAKAIELPKWVLVAVCLVLSGGLAGGYAGRIWSAAK